MKTSTKIAIGVFGLGIVAIGVDAVLKDRGQGTIVLFAPADTAVSVRVDGGAPIALGPGEVRRLAADHGTHQIEIDGGALARSVTIDSGRQSRGIPLLAEQCFVELEVSGSHYGESAGHTLPSVSQTFRHAEPFAVAAGVWHLTEAELPEQVTDRVRSDGTYAGVQLVHLFRTVPCTAMDAGADATLAALGYVGGPAVPR